MRLAIELRPVDREDAIRVGREIQQHHGGTRQKVQVRVALSSLLAAAAGGATAIGRGRHFRRFAGVLGAGLELFATRTRVADGPRIQQQPRALQHIARIPLRKLPVKDVTVLIADFAARFVEGLCPGPALLQQSRVARESQPREHIVCRHVARSQDVNACERRRIGKLQPNGFFCHRNLRQVQRRQAARLQCTGLRERKPVTRLAIGQSHRNRPGIRLEVQGVVAGGQVPQFEETVSDSQCLAPVEYKTSPLPVQQRDQGHIFGVLVGKRQPQRLARNPVQLSGIQIGMAADGPGVLRAHRALRAETLDAVQQTQVTTSRRIGLQRGLHLVPKETVFEPHLHALTRTRFAVLATHFQDVAPLRVAHVQVLNRRALLDLVQREGHTVVQILLLVATDVLHARP